MFSFFIVSMGSRFRILYIRFIFIFVLVLFLDLDKLWFFMDVFFVIVGFFYVQIFVFGRRGFYVREGRVLGFVRFGYQNYDCGCLGICLEGFLIRDQIRLVKGLLGIEGDIQLDEIYEGLIFVNGVFRGCSLLWYFVEYYKVSK